MALRYWWVNQNQTHREERAGGYLWSPKRTAGDRRNQFYENMRLVAPGDIVFSFVGGRIVALGTVTSLGYESPKPTEFGVRGANWADIGWRVDVAYEDLNDPVRPKDFIDVLKPYLPPQYSPLQSSGNGNQGVYLAEVSEMFARILVNHMGMDLNEHRAHSLVRDNPEEIIYMGFNDVRDAWETTLQEAIKSSPDLAETEKESLIRSRIGQGSFRRAVFAHEHECRITHIHNPAYLVASHIKPWRHCSNQERLDAENGLVLCPNIDLLFDRGLITFSYEGELRLSPRADQEVLEKMSVDTQNTVRVGHFTERQQHFLEHHQQAIFLDATG